MTKDELKARIVEATLGGGFKTCKHHKCGNKYLTYDVVYPGFADEARCPWCIRQALTRSYDSAAHAQGPQMLLQQCRETLSQLEDIIREQEWCLAVQ